MKLKNVFTDLNQKINRNRFSDSLPYFIIAGAQKSGTTTLHRLLEQHPQLKGSSPKELHYFDKKPDERMPLKEYKKHFRASYFHSFQFFESTPNYMYQPEFAAEITRLNPEIKIILILREPVARAFSAWNMYKQMFDKNRGANLLHFHKSMSLYNLFYKDRDVFPNFEECLQIEQELIKDNGEKEPSLIRRGLYAPQIQKLYEQMPQNNLYICESQELKSCPKEKLKEIETFLGIDPYQEYEIKNWHVRAYDQTINIETQKVLKAFYRKPNEDLFQLIQQRFPWND